MAVPGYIPLSTETIVNLLDSQMHPAWQDCMDSVYYDEANSLDVIADQTYLLEVNCLAYEDHSFPNHITSLWDSTENKMVLNEVINSPLYVARIGFTFKPSAAAAGTMDLTLTPDNVSPDFSLTRTITFKSIEAPISESLFFYVKGQTKTDGLKAYYTPSANGKVWGRGILVGRSS